MTLTPTPTLALALALALTLTLTLTLYLTLTSCAGQPSELELVNSMGSGKPGCLDAMECRYYDHNTSAWSTEGCTTTQYNRSGVSAIGCSCSHLSDFVAVKVPTSLREKLDLALIVVPRSSPAAADPPPEYIIFDMTVTPGNRFVALTKDGVSAPPTKVTVRLSYAEAEPPQLWRIVSIGCANDTSLCALPTSAVALADQSKRWQITRPDARIAPAADFIISFNASGLPENPAADAYSTELGVEVVEASGAVRLATPTLPPTPTLTLALALALALNLAPAPARTLPIPLTPAPNFPQP